MAAPRGHPGLTILDRHPRKMLTNGPLDVTDIQAETTPLSAGTIVTNPVDPRLPGRSLLVQYLERIPLETGGAYLGNNNLNVKSLTVDKASGTWAVGSHQSC